MSHNLNWLELHVLLLLLHEVAAIVRACVSFFCQNASNEQCSMCGPAVETHTVHRPVGCGHISLIQQVSNWALIQTCWNNIPKSTNSFYLCKYVMIIVFTITSVMKHLNYLSLNSLITCWHRKPNGAISFLTPLWLCEHIKHATILSACCYM